jgi:hypothetical protein
LVARPASTYRAARRNRAHRRGLLWRALDRYAVNKKEIVEKDRRGREHRHTTSEHFVQVPE